MRRLLTIVVVIALLLSGILTPSLEAASAQSSSAGCAGNTGSAQHHCCCALPPDEPCPCEVAPSTPLPQPLERAARTAQRDFSALAPSLIALPAVSKPSLTLRDRFGRHGHRASASLRLHLLESVFRE